MFYIMVVIWSIFSDGLTKAVTHKDSDEKKNVVIWFWPGLYSLTANAMDEESEPDFEIIVVKDYNTFWVDMKA